MKSLYEKLTLIITSITKSTWLVVFSFLILGILLKLMYIFATTIWRVDIFFHIQSAKTILDGGVLFRDFGNSHPAGIVFLHWLFMTLFGYYNIAICLKVTAFITQTGSAYFIYRIIRKGYSDTMGYVCALIFIIALTINWQLWPANIMLLYLLPAMGGLYFIYEYADRQSIIPYFISGFLFSLSAFLCTNTIFYTLLVPVISYYTCRNFKKLVVHSLAGFTGFLIPVFFNFGYFYYHNALSDYYLWNVIWASAYASYKPFYMRFINIFVGLGKTWEWIPLYIFSFYGLYLLLKNKLYRNDFPSFLALVVFIISILSRLGMVRSPIRYSLYILPGLIILLPITFRYYNLSDRIKFKRNLTIFCAAFIVIVFAYTNYIAYSVSRGSIDYGRKELHKWVKENTTLDDSIFVWGEGYEIYYYTGRKMATSMYSTKEFLDQVDVWKANNYKDLHLFWERFIYEFKRDRPKILIDVMPDFKLINNWERKGEMKKYFDIFKEYLDQNYTPVKFIDGARIYKRKD